MPEQSTKNHSNLFARTCNVIILYGDIILSVTEIEHELKEARPQSACTEEVKSFQQWILPILMREAKRTLFGSTQSKQSYVQVQIISFSTLAHTFLKRLASLSAMAVDELSGLSLSGLGTGAQPHLHDVVKSLAILGSRAEQYLGTAPFSRHLRP